MTQNNSIPEKLHDDLVQKAHDDLLQGINVKFEENEYRVKEFSFKLNEILIDMSKTHIDKEVLSKYLDFANTIDFDARRRGFLSGEKINNSEGRSVLHTLLRSAGRLEVNLVSDDLENEAQTSFAMFKEQYDQISESLSDRDVPIKDIIHVGIGGSALGPQLVYEALRGLNAAIKVHFVGNIDAHQLVDVLANCDPSSTLVIGVSKTFTTAETLKNLSTIQAWFLDSTYTNPLDNFIGVTANPAEAQAFGLKSKNIVHFPTWVGGRYSVWSSVSLSVALVIGWEAFSEFLEGAAEADIHFASQDLEGNIPFISAAIDHYYANYLNSNSRAIFAYDYRLRSLVDYLQQLETESNGKDRQRDGLEVSTKTSPVIWGGVGTDVQHSVFQMLHQGTSLIHSEFILVKNPDHQHADHHRELLANGVAQTAALLAGQDRETVERLHASEDLGELAILAKQFSGERPSTTYVLKELSPKNLGSLLSLYEHRTFCFGVLCNINSFDQMGVELGKRLARQISPLIEKPGLLEDSEQVEGLDPSTLSILNKLL